MKNHNLIIEKYTFKDLIDLKSLRKLFENFSEATGFTTGLVSYPEQELLIGTGWRDICTKFHRVCPESEIHCRESNKALTDSLKQSKKTSISYCKNGLVDGATPVIIKGKHVASLFTGQILFEEPDDSMIKSQAEEYGFDLEAYSKAFREVPVVTEKQFKRMLIFLSDIAVLIGEMGLNNLSLEYNEAKFSAVFNQASEGISLIDKDGIAREWNKFQEKLTGIKRNEAVGKPIWELINKVYPGNKDKAKLTGMMAGLKKDFAKGEVEKHPKSVEAEYEMPDGTKRIVERHGFPVSIGDETMYANFSREITKQKQVEKLLKIESILATELSKSVSLDEKLRLCLEFAFNTSNMDSGGVYLYSGKEQSLNLAVHKGLTDNFVRIISSYGTDSPNFQLIMKGKPIYTEYNILGIELDEKRKKEGLKSIAILPVFHDKQIVGCINAASHTMTKIPDSSREALEFIASYVGIFIRNSIWQKTILENEERFRLAVESASDIVFEIDISSGKIEWFGDIDSLMKEEKNSFPRTVDTLMGRIFPDDIEKVKDLLKAETGMRKKSEEEYRVISGDGTVVFLTSNMTTAFDENKEPVRIIGAINNVTSRKEAETEKKKLEEQLLQSQKMESIGRLAGGIAHDFNNILVGIMGYAELLKLKFEDPSTLEGEAADIIIKGAERAADLTQQLLGFARGGKYNPVPLKINDVIKETIKVSEKIFEKLIQVSFDFEKDIYTIEADKNQLNQVLTNLIINAKDAMPKGGKIFLKTQNMFIDKEFAERSTEFESGSFVKVTVTDTGTGMTQEVLESAFEPFFTTKGKGKGTGLGLATVYGIVKNHGGHIDIYSKPGMGTTFNLYFPVSEKVIETSEKTTEITTGEATVLVVDDEESVRKYSKQMLQHLEYKVLLAKDGIEAVKIYKQYKEKIDLVLLDMIMPEMGGRETNIELIKINPDVKVLLASGYSQIGMATEILNEGAAGFIQKPFRMQELSKSITEVLNK